MNKLIDFLTIDNRVNFTEFLDEVFDLNPSWEYTTCYIHLINKGLITDANIWLVSDYQSIIRGRKLDTILDMVVEYKESQLKYSFMLDIITGSSLESIIFESIDYLEAELKLVANFFIHPQSIQINNNQLTIILYQKNLV